MANEAAIAELELRTGEHIAVLEVFIRVTYGNLLAGKPYREYNERLLHRLASEPVQLWGDESPATLLQPTPGEMSGQLPRYAITLLLDCAAPISAANDGSRLRLVYFADTMPGCLAGYLTTILQNLDWKSHARDYEF
jgi:hypothetical protein